MHWSARYVGLSVDEIGTVPARACWDLGRLVYREVLGIVLPAHGGLSGSPAERMQVAAVIAGEASAWPWMPVDPGQARDFDVAAFRIGALDAHLGLICAPDRMLHIEAGHDSTVIRLMDCRWATRLSGIYRHAETMDRAHVA